MKKLLSITTLILMLFSLAACARTGQDPTAATPTGTTSDPGTQTPQTEQSTTPDNAYLLTVKNHDELIFDEPTYDGRCVGTVRQAGVYTIVEEVTDDESNRWGRLKSGAGWLDLTQVEENNAAELLMTAAELTYALESPYLQASQPTEHSIALIFHAYDRLVNVRLYSLAYDGETYEPAEPMYVAEEMDATQPMVAHLEFSGDLTMFGVSFQDASGNFHHYRISTNGRNNAIGFVPYDPT